MILLFICTLILDYNYVITDEEMEIYKERIDEIQTEDSLGLWSHSANYTMLD